MTEAPQSHRLLETLREAVQGGLPAAIADLGALVRIPSVSWDGFDPTHMHASAEAVKVLLEQLGVFDAVEIASAPIDESRTGQPALLATRAAKHGRPTILLYAHHDVQPPGQDADWQSAPFEPTVRGDRLYGRGAADDKAGVIAHVAAIRAFVETVGTDFDLGLVAFFEGEEEFGSRSFKNFIIEHREQLAADVIVVADSDNWDIRTPALTVGLRGNVIFKLTISTLEHASHSGMYGGAAPDAMLAAIRLLDTLWAEDGSVAVEGLTSRAAATPAYTEQKLIEMGLVKGKDYAVGKYPFTALGKAIAAAHTDGFCKIIRGLPRGEILGAHIMGDQATELIAELSLARRLEATTEEIICTTHAHPTMHESVREAALDSEGRVVNA